MKCIHNIEKLKARQKEKTFIHSFIFVYVIVVKTQLNRAMEQVNIAYFSGVRLSKYKN